MPQMAPISWLALFMLFTVIFILFNVMNYFCLIFTPQASEKAVSQLNTPSINWKW